MYMKCFCYIYISYIKQKKIHTESLDYHKTKEENTPEKKRAHVRFIRQIAVKES